MITDMLQSSLSPTQQRGESKLVGGIIHDTITDANGDEFKIKIDYTLSGEICVSVDYSILGQPVLHGNDLIEILQDIIERTEGHTLNFDL